jgi:hypothetical protein
MTLKIGWLHEAENSRGTWLHQADDWHSTPHRNRQNERPIQDMNSTPESR